MRSRGLPDSLSPEQVVDLQDALLANADRLLDSARAVLGLDNVALARALAILGLEESAKAIALHNRRVGIALAPEGEPFVNKPLKVEPSHLRTGRYQAVPTGSSHQGERHRLSPSHSHRSPPIPSRSQ